MKTASREKAKIGPNGKDAARAADRLNAILGSGDQAELLIALRELTRDFGGIHEIARQAKLNRSQLYRTLSEQGNPAFRTLVAILRTMGLQVAVQPLRAKRSRQRTHQITGRRKASTLRRMDAAH
jgi:probable addiction module antidote protein